MRFYRIAGPDVWGDLGSVLIGGVAWRPDDSGPLHLKRTGPFVPPIMVSWYDVIVTSDFRNRLEQAFPALVFQAIVKAKIVELHWEDWPWDAKPREWPSGPDPEDYINLRPHSEETSRAVGDLWELKLDVGAESDFIQEPDRNRKTLLINGATWTGAHFFWAKPRHVEILVVSEKARDWLTSNVPNRVRFKEIRDIASHET